MTKGYDGQSCSEAIELFVKQSDHPLTYSEIHHGISSKGDWKENTIQRIMMSIIVNLVPARYEWPSSHPFLLLRPDGKYEIYDKNKHPAIIE
jgi:hypothetical protein